MSEDPFKKTEGVSSGAGIRKNVLNIGIFFLKVLLILFAGPALVRFFLPVLAAWVIAQLANPLVHFLEKHLHIVRKHSSFGIIAGAILLIVLLCYGVIALLVSEAARFIDQLPAYYDILVQGTERIAENLQGLAVRISPDMRERIAELTDYLISNLGQIVSSLGGVTMEAAGNAARNIPSLLISFLFVLLFSYFFIAQRDRMHRMIGKIVPEHTRQQVGLIWRNMKSAVGGYFRAQFKIMGIVGLILAAGLLIMRIDYAVLWAVLIAVLDFLPMLGTGTALIPWALFCALSDAVPRAVGLLVLYAVTQVTRQLIQPKMVGDSIGMDTLTTLFFMFIGYRLHGLLGMIVAIPVGLILMQLYEAGAFADVTENMRELMETLQRWRKQP